MALSSLLPQRLSAADRQHIAGRIDAALSRRFLDAVECVAARNRGDVSETTFLQALSRICGGPGPMPEWAVHWAVPFFMERLAQGGEPARAALSHLLVSLLWERCPDGTLPLEGARFQTPPMQGGALPVFTKAAWLPVPEAGPSADALNWECSRGMAAFWHGSGRTNARRMLLPLRPDSEPDVLRPRPFGHLKRWNVPLLPVQLAGSLIGQALRPVADQTPVAVWNGLADAHEILRLNWPEVLPWFEIMIPAIGDVGDPLEPGHTYSGSFGPGTPICLSRVHEPLHYAENLVHELQHQRFLLTIPASRWFPRWKDPEFVSPYRPDPRPLSGLHLGLHAFIAVNELRLRVIERRQVSSALAREMLRTHRQNLFAFRTLVRHEHFTADASSYWEALATCLARHGAVVESLVSPVDKQEVVKRLESHVAGVSRNTVKAANAGVSLGEFVPAESGSIAAFAEAI